MDGHVRAPSLYLLTSLVVLLSPWTVTVIFFASEVVGSLRDKLLSPSLLLFENMASLERELPPLFGCEVRNMSDDILSGDLSCGRSRVWVEGFLFSGLAGGLGGSLALRSTTLLLLVANTSLKSETFCTFLTLTPFCAILSFVVKPSLAVIPAPRPTLWNPPLLVPLPIPFCCEGYTILCWPLPIPLPIPLPLPLVLLFPLLDFTKFSNGISILDDIPLFHTPNFYKKKCGSWQDGRLCLTPFSASKLYAVYVCRLYVCTVRRQGEGLITYRRSCPDRQPIKTGRAGIKDR